MFRIVLVSYGAAAIEDDFGLVQSKRSIRDKAKLSVGDEANYTDDVQGSAAQAWGDEPPDCNKLVKGSVPVDAGWFGFGDDSLCECPRQFVVSGSPAVCQAKWDNFDPSFSADDEAFKALKEGDCECKHRPGCGVTTYSADQVIPAKADEAGLPPPVIVGNSANMDIGVDVLNENWYGVWWMKDNPMPEELASFAFAYSRLSNQTVDVADVDWPLKVRVPNAGHNRWAWPDSFLARSVIMPTYTDPNAMSNNFTMTNATDGGIDTGLTDVPLVWVESFTFHKIDEHRWLRPTIFQDRALHTWVFGKTHEYTLTRIVDGDNEPTQYFEEFKKHMGETELLVWDSDSVCKRNCMLSSSNTCKSCHECCVKGAGGSCTPDVNANL